MCKKNDQDKKKLIVRLIIHSDLLALVQITGLGDSESFDFDSKEHNFCKDCHQKILHSRIIDLMDLRTVRVWFLNTCYTRSHKFESQEAACSLQLSLHFCLKQQ